MGEGTVVLPKGEGERENKGTDEQRMLRWRQQVVKYYIRSLMGKAVETWNTDPSNNFEFLEDRYYNAV